MRLRTISFPLKVAVGIIAMVMLSTAFAHAATIQLPKGTEIKLRFAPGMKVSSGELAKDVPLLVSLAQSIQVGSKIIVEEGAQGTAKVIEVKKAGRAGKPGYIKVEFVDLETKGEYTSPYGNKIKLTGTAENKGKSKKTMSYLFILGLFIKGKQGELASGQIFDATVAESIILESK